MKINSKKWRNVYYFINLGRLEYIVYLSGHAGRFMELAEQLTAMKSLQKLQLSSADRWCRAVQSRAWPPPKAQAAGGHTDSQSPHLGVSPQGMLLGGTYK